MAQRFEMDPQATGSGLAAAGQCRVQDVATSIPALPTGTYIAEYSALSTSVLTTLGADVGAEASTGLANSASSAASTESTEAANTSRLST